MRRRSQLLYWILMLWSNHFDYSQWSCGNSFPFLRRRKNRDLLQLGRQRQGRRRLKNKYIFFIGISRMTGCVYLLLQRRKLTSAKRVRAALSSKKGRKTIAFPTYFRQREKYSRIIYSLPVFPVYQLDLGCLGYQVSPVKQNQDTSSYTVSFWLNQH